MIHKHLRPVFYVILLVAFFDWVSVGFVYPLFSPLLYEPGSAYVSPSMSEMMRGVWLGILVSLTPLFNFFCSPIVGMISDQYGRKKVLQFTLSITVIGYLMSFLGIAGKSLYLLACSRILVGIGSSNGGILRAIISDISGLGEKGKNFGLLNMAIGLGYAAGPWLGMMCQKIPFLGLSALSKPFLFATLFSSFNLVFLYFFLHETLVKHLFFLGHFFHQQSLKEIFRLKGMGTFLTGIFIIFFGWAFYWGFIPVTWIQELHLSTAAVGDFFAYAALIYALSSGLLIRPIMSKWGEGRIMLVSTLGLGLSIGLLYFGGSYAVYWVVIPIQQFFLALFLAAAPTALSDFVSPAKQGQALGIFASIKSLGYTFSPLFSGVLIEISHRLPMLLGGIASLFALALIYWKYGKRLWVMHPR